MEKRETCSSKTKHYCISAKHLAIEMDERGYGLRFTQCGVVHDDGGQHFDGVHGSNLAFLLRTSFL